MKRIVQWYKKWNQELETKFLASLVKINFMTNLLDVYKRQILTKAKTARSWNDGVFQV